MNAALTAEIVEYAGRIGDPVFQSVRVNVEGLNSPWLLTMQFPKCSCDGIASRVKPEAVYRAVVRAINESKVTVEVSSAS